MRNYNEMSNIGSSKYVVNYHNGKLHEDGSQFYDISIFSNKLKKDKFIKELKNNGYQLTK